MTIFILLLLAVPAFGLTLYPLLRPRPQVSLSPSPRDEAVRDLLERRDAAYEALKDLEFEYQTGGLSEPDFRELQQKYEDRALSVLKRLDSMSTPGGVDDEIERQVARLRKVRGEVSETPSPAPATASTSTAAACPDCGEAARPGDRFCRDCGADLTPKTPTCPNCQTVLQKGDRFCSKCGTRIANP